MQNPQLTVTVGEPRKLDPQPPANTQDEIFLVELKIRIPTKAASLQEAREKASKELLKRISIGNKVLNESL